MKENNDIQEDYVELKKTYSDDWDSMIDEKEYKEYV